MIKFWVICLVISLSISQTIVAQEWNIDEVTDMVNLHSIAKHRVLTRRGYELNQRSVFSSQYVFKGGNANAFARIEVGDGHATFQEIGNELTKKLVIELLSTGFQVISREKDDLHDEGLYEKNGVEIRVMVQFGTSESSWVILKKRG